MNYEYPMPANVKRWQWKNQKRWIKDFQRNWIDDNPTLIPPWLNEADRTRWYQARTKAQQENDKFQSLVDRIEEEQRRRAEAFT